MAKKDQCCVGEPWRGEPGGLHSMDCPVYLANAEAMERIAHPPRAEPAIEPLRQSTTLLYAWDTRWCPDCGSRYFAEDAECCGSLCIPVRLEMHSREPL